MFDKVIFNITISTEKEALQIATRNNLTAWKSNEETEYKSTEKANFGGVFLNIKNGKLKIICSLHKQYSKEILKKLDNSGMFTMSNARHALEKLFSTVGVEKEKAKVTYFEIGLNLPTKYEAVDYIRPIKRITSGKAEKEKILFEDANFEEDRQKTTRKTKTIKKVFKVYDKEFENANRRREPLTGEHVLRIETMYRRQNISVSDFFHPANIERLLSAFFFDWSQVEFIRTITAETGTRKSEISNAEKVLLLGDENYLKEAKADFQSGKMTAKQYRTIREFCRDWNDNKHKYRMLPSEHEQEYRRILSEYFNIAKNK